MTANKKAIVAVCKFFGALILIGGVVYSEILFLGIVSELFPEGAMMIGAMLGAVTTGASILLLVLAKSHWFRPGTQLIVAWIFTLTEVAVLIMNDILAYQIHQGGQLDQYMGTWRLFCVAAPVISIVGWILCFYFDPERSIAHKRMEMEDNQAKAKIDFETAMHDKVMAIQYRTVDMVGSRLEERIERRVGPHLDRAADIQAARILTQLIGEHVPSSEIGTTTSKQLTGGKVVEGSIQPAKAASRDAVIDPHKIKPQIDNEKKDLSKKTKLLDFSIPGKKTQKIETEEELSHPPGQEEIQDDDPLAPNYAEQEIEEETIEEWKPGDPLPNNYLEWTDAQWKEAKNKVDAFTYDAMFKETFGESQPVVETPKKGKGGRKPKNVTRREVLGMGNQGETERS